MPGGKSSSIVTLALLKERPVTHKTIAATLLVAGILVGVPASLRAQSGIAGVVRDSTGAVLPGVTVEASSEVLIEKVRTATTDKQGQFRIIDLRPGTVCRRIHAGRLQYLPARGTRTALVVHRDRQR